MFLVQCKQCRAQGFTEDGNSLDATVTCNCCPEDHDHAANANACPGAGMNHEGAPCPEADPINGCFITPAGEECPGGHCGLGVDGCTVCRPVVITLLPGSAAVTGVS